MWQHLRHLAIAAIIFCWSVSHTNARSATLINAVHHPTQTPLSTQQQELKQYQAQYQSQQNANSATSETESTANSSDSNETDGPSVWQDLSMVYQLYQQCTGENLSICLKVKLLTGLEKMLRTVKTLQLIEGVQFVKSEEENEKDHIITNGKSMLNGKDIEAVLPRSLDAKEQTLNNLIFKRLATFLRDHTLQIKFPDIRASANDENSFTGRKKDKDKKGGGGAYIMIPLLLGGTFVPIAYGALAMLAGKALIVSKLALVLASIIGIKKLLSGGGKESHEMVVSSGGHSGWGRDFDIAYAGWKPHKAKIL